MKWIYMLCGLFFIFSADGYGALNAGLLLFVMGHLSDISDKLDRKE